MKSCDHTRWLGICERSGKPALVQSYRPAAIADDLPSPDTQRPSIFVLIGNVEKSIVLHALFGVKKARTRIFKQRRTEVHLHLDPASTFTDRPILLASCDTQQCSAMQASAQREKCHREERHFFQVPASGVTPEELLPQLLFPHADVFCFFADDLGGFRPIAQRLALWLNQSRSSTPLKTTLPSMVIVTSKLPSGVQAEERAKRAFLLMLEEETAVSPYYQLSAIDVVAVLPKRAVSTAARCRVIKDRLMEKSDYVRMERKTRCALYSATHMTAFLHAAAAHFARSFDDPFDFIHASRAHNHVAPDLTEHFSNFMNQIVSSTQLTEFAAPMLASTLLLDSYPPSAHHVFDAIYRPALLRMSAARVIALAETNDVILRSGLISMVETHLARYFEQLVAGRAAACIHADNLARFQPWWPGIQSSSTCLCCLRRRPQYGLPCGHCICENCILVFADRSDDDPWTLKVRQCFLCGHAPPVPVAVRVHPPTAGAGVMCIDGGGARGISALVLMKRIQDRIGLPIPLQRFVKVAFGVSIGAVIVMDHYINGRSLTDAIQMFPDMMERTFQRRVSCNIPFLSRALELTASCLADGLYSIGNLEAAVKDALGADKHILEASYATSTGTRVGLPVATVSRHPSYRVFTNYNGVGSHSEAKSILKPKDGAARVPLWEIARAVTAAPGFFPPMHINNVGTFQDAGPLENNPLLWALAEAAALFPHAGQPDFVVSLGTGEPAPSNYDVSTTDCRSVRKNGMLCRIRDLLLEKTRDRAVQRACRSVALAGKVLHRIHRLSVGFDGSEPRLDDTSMIPELTLKSQADPALTLEIDVVARRMVASLFYFELDGLPQWHNGRYLLRGHVRCSIHRGDVALAALLRKLVSSHGRFLVGDWAVSDALCVGTDGNFCLSLDVETKDKFTVTLQLADEEAGSNISGSPFSVRRLVAAQGLDATFGRSDHRKRKRTGEEESSANKRRRM
ncbi:FabD/lysophospholipase-like protein [Ophiobolus disseminans]|uniref:FabD/lysophospholipase-like protein n=1 Tax=Ophiobolus disseminans TaxID=1469910 RepID=A0A6A6ZCW4_9PLEO|nr:FabD/lysophospholipase-like protein [Ophiobolus disseminans]